nr:uncharacterized protein CI109_001418 [Kwoniella shandongensis]KAA5530015.1 hypothetical protein CI109_001418 [Kwoniella shandongensis]
MFEEDFERCFICQQPCKGLYCSSECRQRDQGTLANTVPANFGPVKITSQLPPSLSPHIRPANTIGLSPRTLPQNRATSNGGSSTSSSVSSSPLQSPRTSASEVDSPKKDTFNLPPPAYPSKQLASISHSIPMKIPVLVPRTGPTFSSSQTPGSHGNAIFHSAASIDTLRFGRKPSAVNSVTSPNALLPRCACGKPAGHQDRAASRERTDPLDSGFSRLALDPSYAAPQLTNRSLRIVSDPAIPPYNPPGRVQSNHVTPEPSTSVSLLSRSRSDPVAQSPKGQRYIIPPAPVINTSPAPNVITPSRRATDEAAPISPVTPSVSRPTRRSPNALDVTHFDSPRRGRSRERQEHHIGQITPNAILNHPADREQAPSRSRTRRESRRRSDDRERERGREFDLARERENGNVAARRSPRSPLQADVPQILPSWSRRTSMSDHRPASDGLAPVMRRTTSGEKKAKSPLSADAGQEEEKERKKEELKRATEQLNQVFGVAAG